MGRLARIIDKLLLLVDYVERKLQNSYFYFCIHYFSTAVEAKTNEMKILTASILYLVR